MATSKEKPKGMHKYLISKAHAVGGPLHTQASYTDNPPLAEAAVAACIICSIRMANIRTVVRTSDARMVTSSSRQAYLVQDG